jgi:rhamnose utilization protein RhaD (predicted bifunctional aldolase and dehydrogenase)
VAKVGTSNPDRTINLKRLQCVVENKQKPLTCFEKIIVHHQEEFSKSSLQYFTMHLILNHYVVERVSNTYIPEYTAK